METVRKEYSEYSWTGECWDCKDEGGMKTECLECGNFVCNNCCISQYKKDDEGVHRRITVCDTCLDNMTEKSMAQLPATLGGGGGKMVKMVEIKGGGFWPKRSKIKPPNPLNTLYDTIPEGDEFEIAVSDDQFFQILQWILEETIDEIAGFAYWDEESNAITWAYKAEAIDSSGAHVATDSGPAIVAALTAGFPPPNIQWHTHPGFGAYFSTTDTADQVAAVQRSMKTSPSGSRTFMVISELTWMLQTIRWENGEILSRHEGHVKVRDTKLKWSDWNSTLKKNAGKNSYAPQYGYGGHGGYGDYGGYWGNEGLQPIQAPMQLWDKETGDWIDVKPDEAMMAQDAEYDEEVPLGPKDGAYVPTDEGDDYVFFDNSRHHYIGKWSNVDSDYDMLFESQHIEKYDWTFLFYALSNEFGEEWYRHIVENPDYWGEIL